MSTREFFIKEKAKGSSLTEALDSYEYLFLRLKKVKKESKEKLLTLANLVGNEVFSTK
jgi:hypothetical protein